MAKRGKKKRPPYKARRVGWLGRVRRFIQRLDAVCRDVRVLRGNSDWAAVHLRSMIPEIQALRRQLAETHQLMAAISGALTESPRSIDHRLEEVSERGWRRLDSICHRMEKMQDKIPEVQRNGV